MTSADADIREKKAQLRKEVRKSLMLLTPEERICESKAVAERVMQLEVFKTATTVLMYRATTHECDPSLIALYAKGLGKTVAYPVCEAGNRLGLFVPYDDTAFTVGSYGIMEPDVLRSTRIDARDIDLAIVPCMAVDRHGNRLGHGGGYYDRLLSAEHIISVCIALNCQIIDCVPCDSTDVKPAYTVTGKWIYCE